jgi:hypothetical protein
VPFSVELADRLRVALGGRGDVREVAMFGGRSFMVGGRLVLAAHSSGGLLVRCAPSDVAELVATTAAAPAEMKGRPMSPGWLLVPADAVAGDDELRRWVGLAAAGPAAG